MKKELPMRAQRAITVTMPYQPPMRRRCPGTDGSSSCRVRERCWNWTRSAFAETWVLESECPPAVRRLFDGMPAYASWRWGKS